MRTPGDHRRRSIVLGVLLALLVAACAVEGEDQGGEVTASASEGPGSEAGGSDAASETGEALVGSMLEGATGGVEDLELTAEEQELAQQAAEGQLVGIVAPLSAEYLSAVATNAQETAESLGLQAEVFDYQFDAARGVTGIETFVSQGADYIICVLTDAPAMIGAVQAAVEQGVTVIQFAGRQVADEAGGFSVSIDDAELGAVAGQAAAEIAAERGPVKIAILDFPDQPNVIIRADNIEEQLRAGAPEAEIVGRFRGGTTEAGLSSTESALQAHPDLGGVVSVNDAGAYGAVEALRAAGRTPETAFVVGIDAEGKALEEIRSGSILAATVDTQPALTGQLAAQVIGKLLAGAEVPQYTTVPVEPVTE